MDPFNFEFGRQYNRFYPLSFSTPVYPLPYPTSASVNEQVHHIGVSLLTNAESLETRQLPISLTNLPPLNEFLSQMSKSLQSAKEIKAQTINDFLLQGKKHQEIEGYDSEENRSNKKARTTVSDFQEDPLAPPRPKKIGRGAKDFFALIVPHLESIVSLKKQKATAKSSLTLGKDTSHYEQLKKQIDTEEEKLVALILKKFFYKKNQVYLLGGIRRFQALGIMNLKTIPLLQVWHALPPHSRIDILRSTHSKLSLYFKNENNRNEYQKCWIHFKHEERQKFVSDVEELNNNWTTIKVKGLKRNHKTKRLINPYLMNKLKEVKNDEEGLKNFFNNTLELPRTKSIQPEAEKRPINS